ncbi:carboxypeptidase-like regulatory domain-containing protein [Sphingobacterium tabacisoli]|uniref:carboxypeptidase-like regulatory domain-containing protein n=1 Tax=Sphingobacterium tabacisoli TaxID=2044855 RepID=UPI001AEEB4E6|nr:carboxypeptidase-like regulatory domain-containing protein [Sphingobacterium tabacisoli]
MKKIYPIYSLFLLLLFFQTVRAQEVPRIPINTVVDRVQKYFGVYPLEKVHVHFDKPYYAVGDTLWFKTYLYHNPVAYDPSKIAYVDIINGRDSLIQTLRIPLKNNAGAGYFVLDPQVMKQDNYRFRAYTKWMMNFDVGYFFNKIVTVGDAINKKLASEIVYSPEGNKTKATIQFRDSKGALLAKKKVTWEAIDGWDPFDKGKSETDDMGRVTVSFSSKDKEMLKKGRLIVKVDGESSMIGDFPLKNALAETLDVQFFPEGGDLLAGVAKNVAFKAVNTEGKGVKVKGKIIDSKKKVVVEFADLGLGMGYFNLLPVAGEHYKATVSVDGGAESTFDLPQVQSEGINVVVTKVDEEAIQVGLVASDSYFPKIENQPFYIFGQMNGQLIYGAQATMKNASLALSVSVIDETKVPYDDHQENGILSSLLLISDLRGFIEKPGYYFDKEVANRKQAMDALLMTQGFRRFNYDELVAEKYPQVNFMPEQGIAISGTLRLNTGRPYPNGGLLLSIPARALRKDAYTDKDGRFVFQDLNFPDSVKVTVNARSNDNYRNLVINLDQSYYPEVDNNNPYKANDILNIDKQMVDYLANSKNEFRTSNLIDEVTVTASRKEVRTSKEFSALSGLSMADHRIEGDRLSGCNMLTMCLNTLLTGVTYDSQTLKYYLTRSYNQGSRVPVQFFLNGMPIDENTLNSIVPMEIEAIEIFNRDDLGTVSRLYQNDGVVSIITKKEKPKGPRMTLAQIEALLPKSNVVDLYPLGYIKERKFYMPKYDTDQSKSTNDYRTTVYWNPDIMIDETGTIALDYFNADGNGKYKVVVEGIDNAGRIGRTVYYYNVK